ncbi:hypothetical protein Bca4012_065719 [Brassica carinata]|uniref:Transmembrane protein n=1 Tax=Brassica carinata TaxID=52824 RepID=A0A8X8AZ02_BRACI|nr:hypothetical protein Bca52824_018029 [Brassica carinata]
MKSVDDKKKAIDDSGTKLTPVTRMYMGTPRTLTSRIGTPSSSKLISLLFDLILVSIQLGLPIRVSIIFEFE